MDVKSQFTSSALIEKKTHCYHGLSWLGYSSCCKIVKANNQSNGKGQISTQWAFETHERISIKFRTYNYVVGRTTHANPCVVLRQRGWSGRTRDMTSFCVDITGPPGA